MEENNMLSVAEQQKERLRQLLQQKVKQPVELAASCAQRRLWLVNQLEQANASYNIPCHITLSGSLDSELLERSLNQLIARHATLRTSFVSKGGEPQQKISAELIVSLPVVDLTSYDESDRQQQIADILLEESSTIFDLSSDVLIRAKLIHSSHDTGVETKTENGKDEYVLIIVLHHIISDGWSMGVLSRDLFAIYDSLKNDSVPLTPLTKQYADFTRYQLQWLKSDDYKLQLAYWKQHLHALPTLELPTDYIRPKLKRFDGANVFGVINAPLVQRLKTLCDEQSITLNMLLSVTYSLLLHKYTGQVDVVFGSPIANRNNVDVENLIGFFVNMLVIRNPIEPSSTFLSLLQQSRDNLFSAYNNQDVPFEYLVDELQPERDVSRNPLFQVVFAMQNEAMPAIEIEGLTISRPVIPGYDVSEYAVKANVTRFDLELHCWDAEDEIRCSWIYDTALFTQASIDSMNRHFTQLLNAIVNQPDSLVSSLSILDQEEQKTLVEQFQNTQTDYPADKTINELFECQVEATPDATALVFENQTLSYAELNQKANQFARYLQARGVKAEVMVGLSVERSIDMVIALLAILKAGGAYVPLDPEYPTARIAFMLEDTAAPVLITQSLFKSQFPNFAGEIIYLDQDWPAISLELPTNPENQLTADSLMYVVYTSGSTGVPKGVCIEHRSAVRLVKNTNYVDISTQDVLLQFSPVAFDASTFELWGSLLNGAKLVIYPAQKASLIQLEDVIVENAVSILFITSALFNQMVDHHISAFKNVRTLLTGGEIMSISHAKKYMTFIDENTVTNKIFINIYGPTENTTFTSYYVIKNDAKISRGFPIGKPISNTNFFVLDENMMPVPDGISGELYVGGAGLARGYLNNDELTEDKFIIYTNSQNQKVRLYRTGDLVCHRRGDIEFIGRIDNQIKLRGFRIEISEVESTLKKVANIKDAVVLLDEDLNGKKRLVAYLLLQDNNDATISEARNYLKSNLPEYMVPSVFMLVDEFKSTPNGKVDHKQLPQPELDRHVQNDLVAPKGELESEVTAIWKQVLSLGEIGVEDNFFDLGGDSFLMIQLHSALEKAFSKNIPITDLFRFSTIHSFAKHYADQSLITATNKNVQSRAEKQRAAMRKIRRVNK